MSPSNLILKNIQEQTLIRAVLKSPKKRGDVKQITLRPVLIKGKTAVQISTIINNKDITKNYNLHSVKKEVENILKMNFKSIYISTKEKDYQLSLQKGSRYKIAEHKTEVKNIDLHHNKSKDTFFQEGRAEQFLTKLGVQNPEGSIKPLKRDKFNQINQFLKVLDGIKEIKEERELQIIDFGCGKGYLTFAVYYYFNTILKKSVKVTGVDTNKELIEISNKNAKELGWSNLQFIASTIKEFDSSTLDRQSSLIISLHACDTATDDVIAKAIKVNAKYILSSPCCHHNINNQLRKTDDNPLKSIFNFPSLKQRLGDILTDTIRGLILEDYGYKTEIIEFIDPEHTSRNLLIKALKSNIQKGAAKKQLQEIKRVFPVTPYLETVLENE